LKFSVLRADITIIEYRLPFLMVLRWVVEEVFPFLEHFVLLLIEQYVNYFA
jgi:hypothetical protein